MIDTAFLIVGMAENRLVLLQRGRKVMTYEGNMGDDREFYEKATETRIGISLKPWG